MMSRTASDAERCVWMQAGVLTYKLCDRGFACEECPLDIVLRRTEDDVPSYDRSVPTLRVQRRHEPGGGDDVARLLGIAHDVMLPEDALYSPTHVWTRTLASRVAVLGIDPALAGLLPSATRVVLGAGRGALTRGKPFGWLYHGSRVLPLRSPISGVVLRRNPLLDRGVHRPGEGWLVAVMPTNADHEMADLRSAKSSADDHAVLLERFTARAERMLRAGHRAAHRDSASAHDDVLYLNDGGIPVATLEDALGEDRYFELLRSVFFPR